MAGCYCKEIIGTATGCGKRIASPEFYRKSTLGNITSESFTNFVKALMESDQVTRIEIVRTQDSPGEIGWRLNCETQPGTCANKLGHSLMLTLI